MFYVIIIDTVCLCMRIITCNDYIHGMYHSIIMPRCACASEVYGTLSVSVFQVYLLSRLAIRLLLDAFRGIK